MPRFGEKTRTRCSSVEDDGTKRMYVIATNWVALTVESASVLLRHDHGHSSPSCSSGLGYTTFKEIILHIKKQLNSIDPGALEQVYCTCA